jgi:hypothetical protein
MGLKYGLLLGIVLGSIVCWKVWRYRLGQAELSSELRGEKKKRITRIVVTKVAKSPP